MGYVYLNIDIVDFSPNTQFIINVVYEGGKKTWEITGKADENGIYQYFGYLSKFNANKEGPGYYGTYVITIEGEDGFYSQQTLLISK